MEFGINVPGTQVAAAIYGGKVKICVAPLEKGEYIGNL